MLMAVVLMAVVASVGMLVAIAMPLRRPVLIPMAVRHHKPSRKQLSKHDRTSGQSAAANERVSHIHISIRHSRQRQCQGRCPYAAGMITPRVNTIAAPAERIASRA